MTQPINVSDMILALYLNEQKTVKNRTNIPVLTVQVLHIPPPKDERYICERDLKPLDRETFAF